MTYGTIGSPQPKVLAWDTPEELLEHYGRQLEAERRPKNTHRRYLGAARELLRWTPEVPVEDLGPHHVEAYIDLRSLKCAHLDRLDEETWRCRKRGPGRSGLPPGGCPLLDGRDASECPNYKQILPHCMKTHMEGVKPFLVWLSANGILKGAGTISAISTFTKAAAKDQALYYSQRRNHHLSREELRRLVLAAPVNRGALWYVMGVHGYSEHEALAVRYGDFDAKEWSLSVPPKSEYGRKRIAVRTVFLSREGRWFIGRYLRHRRHVMERLGLDAEDPEGAFFVTALGRAWSPRCFHVDILRAFLEDVHAAGIEADGSLTPHGLRRHAHAHLRDAALCEDDRKLLRGDSIGMDLHYDRFIGRLRTLWGEHAEELGLRDAP